MDNDDAHHIDGIMKMNTDVYKSPITIVIRYMHMFLDMDICVTVSFKIL